MPQHVPCLFKISEIAAFCIQKRFTDLRFGNDGKVSLEFRCLSKSALRLVLGENPSNLFNNSNTNNSNKMIETQEKQELSHFCVWSENDLFVAIIQWVLHNPNQRKLSDIADLIRFHHMDLWFLSEIVSKHYMVTENKNILLMVMKAFQILTSIYQHHETHPRAKYAIKYISTMPVCCIMFLCP